MKLRGGEFSTGTRGNFQPELTLMSPCFASRSNSSRTWLSGMSNSPDRPHVVTWIGLLELEVNAAFSRSPRRKDSYLFIFYHLRGILPSNIARQCPSECLGKPETYLAIRAARWPCRRFRVQPLRQTIEYGKYAGMIRAWRREQHPHTGQTRFPSESIAASSGLKRLAGGFHGMSSVLMGSRNSMIRIGVI